MAKLTPQEREEAKQIIKRAKKALDLLYKQPRSDARTGAIAEAEAIIKRAQALLGRHR